MIIICFIAVFLGLALGRWPDPKNTQEHTQRLEQFLNTVIPMLADGKPESHISPFDPLIFPKITKSGKRFKIRLSNIILTGLRNTEIRNISTDWKHMKVFAVIPTELVLKGRYNVIRKLGRHTKTTGTCILTFDYFSVEALMKLSIVNSEGKQTGNGRYLRVNTVKTTFNTNHLSIYFSSLGASANEILNKNWKAVLNALRPSLSAKLEQTIKDTSNGLLQQTNLEQSFLSF